MHSPGSAGRCLGSLPGKLPACGLVLMGGVAAGAGVSVPGPLVAVLCLDGLSFLTGDAAEFSNNIAVNVAWSLTGLCFVWAVRTEKLRWWLALGAAVGLGLLCKYTLGVLLVALFGYLIFDRDGRRQWQRPGPYLAGLLAVLLFFAACRVGGESRLYHVPLCGRASSSPGSWGRLLNPAGFLGEQLLILTPVFARSPRCWPGVASGQDAEVPSLNLLHWVVVAPVALLVASPRPRVASCAASGVRRSGLSPACGCWPWPGPLRRFVLRWSNRALATVAIGTLAFFLVKNSATPHFLGRPTHESFPGRQLAAEVARRWHAGCKEPFPIVAGEAWRADNVCCYSPHRPMIYTSGAMGYLAFDAAHCPWTNDADLAERGGVIVWDADKDGDSLPPAVHRRFAHAQVQPPIILPFQTSAPRAVNARAWRLFGRALASFFDRPMNTLSCRERAKRVRRRGIHRHTSVHLLQNPIPARLVIGQLLRRRHLAEVGLGSGDVTFPGRRGFFLDRQAHGRAVAGVIHDAGLQAACPLPGSGAA